MPKKAAKKSAPSKKAAKKKVVKKLAAQVNTKELHAKAVADIKAALGIYNAGKRS